MSNIEPPEGYEPVPGESRLALVSTAVILGVALTVLICVLIFSPEDFGWPAVFLLFAGIGFAFALAQRRNYLRNRRNGAPVVRRPWRGGSLGPPN